MRFSEQKALWGALQDWRRLMDDRGWLFGVLYAECVNRHARMVGYKNVKQLDQTLRWVSHAHLS